MGKNKQIEKRGKRLYEIYAALLRTCALHKIKASRLSDKHYVLVHSIAFAFSAIFFYFILCIFESADNVCLYHILIQGTNMIASGKLKQHAQISYAIVLFEC